MLRATSTGEAQICGGDGVGDAVGDAVGDGVWLADALAVGEGDPLAGWPAAEAGDDDGDAPGPADADAGAPRASAERLAGVAGAEVAGGVGDDGAFLAGVVLAGVGTVVAGVGTVVAGESEAGADDGAGDAVGGGPVAGRRR